MMTLTHIHQMPNNIPPRMLWAAEKAGENRFDLGICVPIGHGQLGQDTLVMLEQGQNSAYPNVTLVAPAALLPAKANDLINDGFDGSAVDESSREWSQGNRRFRRQRRL